MNEKEFAELIRRCLAGEASNEEASRVNEWLSKRADKDPYRQLGSQEKDEIRKAMFARLSLKQRQVDQPLKAERPQTRTFRVYKVAAGIILLYMFSYTLLELKPDPIQEKVTVLHAVSPPGGSKKIILSDSSIVWLKGNSSIAYSKEFSPDSRNVKLTGEALFEVAKDPDRPFVIECGGLRAKVLGTSFNIKATENDVEVLVLTGKVSLSSEGNTQKLIVHPNEKAVYHAAGNQLAMVPVKEDEPAATVVGTQYSMQFDATRMKEIIRRIEGKFDVRVSLSDERINNCTITADFTDQSLERTLSLISQTLEIEYEVRDERVVLRGSGCEEL